MIYQTVEFFIWSKAGVFIPSHLSIFAEVQWKNTVWK